MNDVVYILAGIIISMIVPLVAAVMIKPEFSSTTKGVISSGVGIIFALGLAFIQALNNHAFDSGTNTLATVIGIVIASHVFYEMFEKALALWIQNNVGVK